MAIPDSSPLNLIHKIKSWFYRGKSDTPGLLTMAGGACNCELNSSDSFHQYRCQNCTRILCENCVHDCGLLDGNINKVDSDTKTQKIIGVEFCKYCSDLSTLPETDRRYSDKIYPEERAIYGPEPQSPGEGYGCFSPHTISKSSVTPYDSPLSVPRSPDRSDEDEEYSISNLFSTSTEYCHDISETETGSVRSMNEYYSLRSVGSSPFDSPSGIHNTYSGADDFVQQDQWRENTSQNNGISDKEITHDFKGPERSAAADGCADDVSIFQEHYAETRKPLDFESNGRIWFPPPSEDETKETDNFFTYDDEDDEIGDLNSSFRSNGNAVARRPLRAALQVHFRTLVSQLLQGEGVKVGRENDAEDWHDVVSAVAWQAANFVKPDTSKGGSMDPVDYIKIKCVASGVPRDSMLIKGVVCTKNIKHKRMTSQHKNPKLLLLGGALEFQGVVTNHLESFDVLRQQEMDHLRKIVSKIEALRTNVLLVEKTVSSYAQECLLAKDISLVLNVKRPLLERIARCTGAHITSVDKISTAQLGFCEHFRLEKFNEELEPANQCNKNLSKTLMFFEGCPRPSGCTIVLKGACREELQKVKHAVQFAVFAAYHLSLETSFLADEGATLPMLKVDSSIAVSERIPPVNPNSLVMNRFVSGHSQEIPHIDGKNCGLNLFSKSLLPVSQDHNHDGSATCTLNRCKCSSDLCIAQNLHLTSDIELDQLFPITKCHPEDHFPGNLTKTRQQDREPFEFSENGEMERVGQNETRLEYCSSSEPSDSILVSLSSRCILNETVCERSRLQRIKYYSPSDKPLGRYLQDDLFGQTPPCLSCKEPTEAHVVCYTHKQGNLTINVRRLPEVELPGERDGKIWMWHRCLKCAFVDGVPPASHRVVMSQAAWGLSWGKFLELSFSNHTTANRVAKCGHSLQRDCLRYYGYGSMVAFFRYSPLDILSVSLPPSILEFSVPEQDWIRKKAAEIFSNAEALYAELSAVLRSIERKISPSSHESSDASELHNHVAELNDILAMEMCYYHDTVGTAGKDGESALDILELNRLRHSLLVGSHVWDRQLNFLESLLTNNSGVKVSQGEKDPRNETCLKGSCSEHNREGSLDDGSELRNSPVKAVRRDQVATHITPCGSGVSGMLEDKRRKEEIQPRVNILTSEKLERAPSAASVLADTIDSAWSGLGQLQGEVQLHTMVDADAGQDPETKDYSFRRFFTPARVHSFDSSARLEERIEGLPGPSLHLSMHRYSYASGDSRVPVLKVQRSISEISSSEATRLNVLRSASSSFISSASLLSDGARLMVAQNSQNEVVIAVYDDDPTSIISYALSSKEHEDHIRGKKSSGADGFSNETTSNMKNPTASAGLPSWKSFGSLDLDYIHIGSYGSEDSSTRVGSFFTDKKASSHLKISFMDESCSNALGKVKFLVTCYFAKQFDALRKECCPSEIDFIRSMSRCKKWSAQGGKSKVLFARSLDERFIIKQVTKTELDSFVQFAPEYFKYLTESLNTGSPTCLAKVLGIYQVSLKYLKGGKETKMDLMVMENLFFKRKISRVYDLKGSVRSRYTSDTSEADNVLLDLNLVETLRTKPIFLANKSKRNLDRAVWNDTSFLASIDVMDYSLLVGVDEESKELVLGIIDFMRQYTWDKHLETWVKASGILGGPKNASPTIISPKQYKKRFRKAMTTYFLSMPHQWSS